MINYHCSSPQSIIHTKVINKLDAYHYFVVYVKHTYFLSHYYGSAKGQKLPVFISYWCLQRTVIPAVGI